VTAGPPLHCGPTPLAAGPNYNADRTPVPPGSRRHACRTAGHPGPPQPNSRITTAPTPKARPWIHPTDSYRRPGRAARPCWFMIPVILLKIPPRNNRDHETRLDGGKCWPHSNAGGPALQRRLHYGVGPHSNASGPALRCRLHYGVGFTTAAASLQRRLHYRASPHYSAGLTTLSAHHTAGPVWPAGPCRAAVRDHWVALVAAQFPAVTAATWANRIQPTKASGRARERCSHVPRHTR
jgi:hypothetical protein